MSLQEQDDSSSDDDSSDSDLDRKRELLLVLAAEAEEGIPDEASNCNCFNKGLGWGIIDAFRFWSGFARVSRRWQLIADTYISTLLVPSVSLRIDEIPNCLASSYCAWLGRRHFRIKSILCGESADWESSASHFARVLKASDLSPLLSVETSLSVSDLVSQSSEKQNCLKVLTEEKCPGLFMLNIGFHVDQDTRQIPLSPWLPLFNFSTISTLDIAVTIHENGVTTPDMFSNFTQTLPCLRRLSLECETETLVSPDEGQEGSRGLIRIASESLESLNVHKFCTRSTRFSLDCPSLQHLFLAAHPVMCHGSVSYLRLNQCVVRADTIQETCNVWMDWEDSQLGQLYTEFALHCIVGLPMGTVVAANHNRCT